MNPTPYEYTSNGYRPLQKVHICYRITIALLRMYKKHYSIYAVYP